MGRPIDVVDLTGAEPRLTPIERSPDDGSRLIEFEARTAGLYQLSVIIDASDFDWERLYIALHAHHNKGRRTGPWDFDVINHNAPLVPSYWIQIDGRLIGLWFFQRVSLEDLEARRFRGRMALDARTAGRHELRLTLYGEQDLPWMSARLEPDPEDPLEPIDVDLVDWDQCSPAAQWAQAAYWESLRGKLATTHAVYREPLRRTFAELRRRMDLLPSSGEAGLHSEDVLPLIALHHLEGDERALGVAVATVEAAMEQEHWGNPREDAYSHDGDIGAGQLLRALAWAYHSLRDALGEERRRVLAAKLRLQGERFHNLALLNRDYWGGSVLQDHGWRALPGFGTAALHLLGIIPEAERWAAYAVPRIRRSLEAMPRDGVVPPSSWCSLPLYVDELVHYRQALLALSGADIFADDRFHAIIDCLSGIVREEDASLIISPSGQVRAWGANAFLNAMATIWDDGRAAKLQEIALRVPESHLDERQEQAYCQSVLGGLLTHDPDVATVAALPPRQPLLFFEDSGLVHYRDPASDVTLSLRCGPWCGYTAYRRAQGPCDRMEMLLGFGHFVLSVGNEPLLVSPDGGYRLSAATRSLLLVDGQGPVGDIGYPMSIPSFQYRGEEVEFARWDGMAGTGHVRLNLAPAYPEALGLIHYTRDFLLHPGEKIVCRDSVVVGKRHALSWHFHGKRASGVVCTGASSGRIGDQPCLDIVASSPNTPVDCAVCGTEVVYSYASRFEEFAHLRFSIPEPVESMIVDFTMTWE